MVTQALVRKEANTDKSANRSNTPESRPWTSTFSRTPTPANTHESSAIRSLFDDTTKSQPCTSTTSSNISLDRSFNYIPFSNQLASTFYSKKKNVDGPKKPNLRCPKACILAIEEHANQCEKLEKEKETKKLLKGKDHKKKSLPESRLSPEPIIPLDIQPICSEISSLETSNHIIYEDSEHSMGI